MGLLEKIFGNYSDKELKRLKPIADRVMALETEMSGLSDTALKAKTEEFRDRLQMGETLDELLPEAFAVVREAAWRVLGMKHFYVQVLGGIILHQGRIAEMKTGEGKTLVSTLPAYLNALTGKGVHVVTVNDYLAKRDSEWMGKVFRFLGLTVGLIVHDLDNKERQAAYNADITYATNNELGFDYLRDNMVVFKEDMTQRGQHYAIVDEVDSILIDEARTPLIISGMSGKSTQLYQVADQFARRLKALVIKETDKKSNALDDTDADYIVDEKAKTTTLTQRGIAKAEAFFNIENLADPNHMQINHHINQAIKAHGNMKRDREYVVQNGQVVIVDEFTGRIMPGRRYSDGLHQAIEAKENVKVEHESKTLATITFQNFFRLYTKLAGMTGTAQTEEAEFQQIYGLDVIVVPTNKDMQRKDLEDVIYKNVEGKYRAIIEQIKECHEKGQPVLVGTVSIEKSELISKLLSRQGIKHNVLNAKHHAKEAEIIAQAGKVGAVTIATNMAGRGTDIMLGGNAEFMAKTEMAKQGFSDELIAESTGFSETDDAEILHARETFKELQAKYKEQIRPEAEAAAAAGGLYVIGTERHESRRVDNQLRGRSGRQGDPGASKFFISMQDDLMRLFGSDRYTLMLEKIGLEEDQPIEAKLLSGAIENAQKHVEGRNFDIRKHVLQYDEVMNEQRKMIYTQRRMVLDGEDMHGYIMKMLHNTVESGIEMYAVSDIPDEWDLQGLSAYATELYQAAPGSMLMEYDELNRTTKKTLKEKLLGIAEERMRVQQAAFGDAMGELERMMLLRVVDTKWMDHIDDMDQLKHGIGLNAYAQRDPVVEYRLVGSDMYDEMLENIAHDTIKFLLRAAPMNQSMEREQVATPLQATLDDGSNVKKPAQKKEKVGRNDPCPCGSGLKYKKCCGKDE